MTEEIFISIHLSTNKTEEISAFLSNVEETSSRPDRVEVLIHIDKGDISTKETICTYRRHSSLKIKYIETNIVNSFSDLWKVYDKLRNIMSEDVYFVTLFSDEFRFETQGWDDVLEKYKHYYKDDIFRIRCSKFRFRNYNDIWECGFAPDSIAFHTKKWLDIVGTWCPHEGPDSFHQCISYYVQTFDSFASAHYNRDIAEPFLRFSGEGVGNNLSIEEKKIKEKRGRKAWFILFSKKAQEKAKKRALVLIMNIKKHSISRYKDTKIKSDSKYVTLVDASNNTLEAHSFKVPRRVAFINMYRKLNFTFYCGGGEDKHIVKLLKKLLLAISRRVKTKTLSLLYCAPYELCSIFFVEIQMKKITNFLLRNVKFIKNNTLKDQHKLETFLEIPKSTRKNAAKLCAHIVAHNLRIDKYKIFYKKRENSVVLVDTSGTTVKEFYLDKQAK